jgi:hyperosmotically inducible protein
MLFKTFATAALAGSLALAGAAQPAAAADQTKAPATTTAQTDDTLKDRVNFRLETSDTLRKYDVKVKVDKGVVTLSGDVVTAAQKAEAERLAKVDGVTRVQNDITIDPNEDKTVTDRVKAGLTKTGEKITDAWITTKVKWFFVGEDALKGSDINVDTKDNVVTLKGTVKSAAGKARAVELAKHTDGVKQVVDQLMVK